ncbi:MAG: hypothetical protein JWO03_2560 [Bacteroidetes bacterium]|nr:hypothetical protein [Bacteroidota bacterium]
MNRIKYKYINPRLAVSHRLRAFFLCIFILLSVFYASAQMTRTYRVVMRSNVGMDTMWDGASFRIYGMAPALSADVSLPSPILYANEGDTLVLNALSISQNEHHTVHMHGMDEDTRNDGDPATSFYLVHNQDTTYTAVCTHAGTYLYHCHVADVIHVQMGMYGMIVVKAANGASTAWTNGPYIHHDYKWLTSEIDRHWHDSIPYHDLIVDTVHIPPYHPGYFLVNGKAQQEIAADDSIRIHGMVSEPIYVRLANIGFYSNRVIFRHSLHAKVIDSDGRPLPSEISSDTVEVMPGERYGVLLQPLYEDSGFVEVQYVNMNTALSEHSEFVPVTISGVWNGIHTIGTSENIRLFPNPTREMGWNLAFDDGVPKNASYAIYDVSGRVLNERKITSAEEHIETHSLPAGVYILKIQTDSGITTRKLMRLDNE